MRYKIILVLLVVLAGCGKESVKPAAALKDVQGEWEIYPALEPEHIVISGESVLWKKNNREERLAAEFDAIGMRLISGAKLTGYFLLKEKTPEAWKGLWEERVVTLRKISLPE